LGRLLSSRSKPWLVKLTSRSMLESIHQASIEIGNRLSAFSTMSVIFVGLKELAPQLIRERRRRMRRNFGT
jgi:hypothetical protein